MPLEVLAELGLQLELLGDFLLRKLVELAGKFLLFNILEKSDSLADGAEVGESSAEPSMADIERARTDSLFLDGLLGIALRADKKDLASLGNDVLEAL